MTDRIKQILDNIYKYNKGSLAEVNFGLTDDIVYDALIIGIGHGSRHRIAGGADIAYIELLPQCSYSTYKNQFIKAQFSAYEQIVQHIAASGSSFDPSEFKFILLHQKPLRVAPPSQLRDFITVILQYYIRTIGGRRVRYRRYLHPQLFGGGNHGQYLSEREPAGLCAL